MVGYNFVSDLMNESVLSLKTVFLNLRNKRASFTENVNCILVVINVQNMKLIKPYHTSHIIVKAK